MHASYTAVLGQQSTASKLPHYLRFLEFPLWVKAFIFIRLGSAHMEKK